MDREPDVEMAISLRAEEVRFECKPEVEVVAHADSPATAESRTYTPCVASFPAKGLLAGCANAQAAKPTVSS